MRGEIFRRRLVEIGAFDRSRKIRSEGEDLYLPILELSAGADEELAKIGEFEVVLTVFDDEPPKETVEGLIGRKPSFEVVGEIAILEDPDEEAAAAIMAVHRNVRAVISPLSAVEGEFRTRRFRPVAGEARTATIHKEHGLRYRIDLERAYFTPRLGTERLRIAELVRPGEAAFDIFAGVGPFALLMAKRGARVVAVDKNPDAVRLLRENAALNRIEDIVILEADASDLAEEFEKRADRIIMNLPHIGHDFLGVAMRIAKKGGVVHYYAIAPEDDLFGRDTAFVEEAARASGVEVEILRRAVVRSYAPHRYNIVIDFRVEKPSKEAVAPPSL
ncbi:class I SAM-dependent methyltransferase family protein [Methanotrichaceae archaeon Mx]|uniref:Class I SAM-dependent methyltransferase family protein n=1 Tax=Candidatus Methanocrinis natronophilus TaxID=3033396 RepID=A0ABT5X7J3_9EURY|nr:class I SAM-dependent methyltransferase family protein [Candidatus Methanocrinis natronophilus]